MKYWKRAVPIILLTVVVSGCLGGEDVHPTPLALMEISTTNLYSNETVTFNGSSSLGHISPIVEYQWNIRNSSLEINHTVEGKKIDHVFTQPGRYNISLTVTDEKGSQDLETRNVTVEEKVLPFDLDKKMPGGENSFEWLYLNNTVINRITHLYWNISIIEGRGNNSRIGGRDLNNPELDLSGDHLILSSRFVKFLFKHSDTVIDKVMVGDHLSFFWPTSMFHFSPWTVLSISVWDHKGMKYAFSHNMDPINLSNHAAMEIDREDTYVDELGYNESTIIYTSGFDYNIPYWAPEGFKIYVAPHNESVLLLNSTTISDQGYFVVEMDRTQWFTYFIHTETWYYDSVLNFRIGSNEISLRRGETGNITIDGDKYSINVVRLYKHTVLETYFLHDLEKSPGQSFYIERNE